MNKVLVASVALLGLGTGMAGAADLPVKSPPPYGPPPFTWTGFYIGANVGGAWSQTTNWTDTFGLNWSNGNNRRFIGGGQLGFNYRFGNFVVGVEGEYDAIASNNNNNNNNVIIVGPLGDTFQLTSNDNWVSTLAARFGFAADYWLFYAKAGGGWVGNNNLTITDLTAGASFSPTSNIRGGVLVGAGIEWAFATNWTLKAEYDYLSLGGHSFTVPGTAIPALAGDVFTSNSRNFQMAKVGANFLFNFGY
jgi:outer membrane immunogenic protein